MKHYAIAGAAVVVALVMVGVVFFVLPELLAENTLTITWYDANGKPVQPPIAFISGGVVVASFDATVGWKMTSTATITAVDIDGDCYVECRLNTQTSGLVSSRRDTIASDKAESSQKFTYVLSTLIGSPTEAGKQYGWSIIIKASLTSVGVVAGDTVTKTWTDSVCILVTWQSEDYTFEGYINT